MLLAVLVPADDESSVVSLKDLDTAVVVSLASARVPAESARVSRPAPPAAGKAWTPAAVAYDRQKVLPKFAAAYRSLLKLVAVMGLPRIQDDAALTQAAIVGTASSYNPYRHGRDADTRQTASGEPYDPDAWTAAIQIDLRAQFGGVRYGRLYRPAFALVESGDKQIIVRINDVGPLRPGRVIDLNERSMRYFDPLLQRGLIDDMKITLLPAADWTPGPVGGDHPISFASAQ